MFTAPFLLSKGSQTDGGPKTSLIAPGDGFQLRFFASFEGSFYSASLIIHDHDRFRFAALRHFFDDADAGSGRDDSTL